MLNAYARARRQRHPPLAVSAQRYHGLPYNRYLPIYRYRCRVTHYEIIITPALGAAYRITRRRALYSPYLLVHVVYNIMYRRVKTDCCCCCCVTVLQYNRLSSAPRRWLYDGNCCSSARTRTARVLLLSPARRFFSAGRCGSVGLILRRVGV